jgi:chemotaxis protein CheY-P-specific phosphatase CheC
VSLLESSELRMAVDHDKDNEAIHTVCQGFVGKGIAGEALLTLRNVRYDALAHMARCGAPKSDAERSESLLDVANMLIGACMHGLATQLDVPFSQSHPALMEKDWLTQRTAARVDPGNHKFLIVEKNIAIAEFAIDGDLLLVFTEDSISNLRQRIQYLV